MDSTRKNHASSDELRFRARLAALLGDVAAPIPPPLAAALDEHLYRHDAQGYSLCWDGPERQRLLADLNPLLVAHQREPL